MPRTQEVSPPHAAALESARQIEFDISGGLTERERERIAQIISQHYAPALGRIANLANYYAAIPSDGYSPKDVLQEISRQIAAVRGEL